MTDKEMSTTKAPEVCKYCKTKIVTGEGVAFSSTKLNRMIAYEACKDHDFFAEKLAQFDRDRHVVVMETGKKNLYWIGDETSQAPSKYRGHAGRKFTIRFTDGRIVETTNLWHNGEIDDVLSFFFAINAKFLIPEEAEVTDCTFCDGDGSYHGASATKVLRCHKCYGTGKVIEEDYPGIWACEGCGNATPVTELKGDLCESCRVDPKSDPMYTFPAKAEIPETIRTKTFQVSLELTVNAEHFDDSAQVEVWIEDTLSEDADTAVVDSAHASEVA